MQKISISKFLPGILWFIIVLVLICIPGKDLPEVDNWFQAFNIDKCIHAFMFGVLSYLFIFPCIRYSNTYVEKLHNIIRISLACTIWGLTTEFIQKYFIPNRNFDWLDWVADTTGILINLIVCRKYALKKTNI